jgi:hypothetical protein
VLKLPNGLDLHVQGHISGDDAERQQLSAQAILNRFVRQPGVILGDEVGMGKTFVALAVAVAHIARDPSRPVVVMAPQNVVSKWVRDSEAFRALCLRDEVLRRKFRIAPAETGVQLLKLLDDSEDDRANLIVMAHGGLHRKLADKWVKLAVLQAAIRGRHGVAELRERLARFGPMLLSISWREGSHFEMFRKLLHCSPVNWKQVLTEFGMPPEDDDDPVPSVLLHALEGMDLSAIFEKVVDHLPVRGSKHFKDRIQAARKELENQDTGLPFIWRTALASMKVSMPLLILDEAHRVRNAGTQLAALLAEQKEDLNRAKGQLAGRFERMLFLTATPFQLGHGELLNVLNRFESVAWDTDHPPAISRSAFKGELDALGVALNQMQLTTDRLERSWKKLLAADLEAAPEHGSTWWALALDSGETAAAGVQNQRLRAVMLTYCEAHKAIRKAECLLKPWVLRASRSPTLHGRFSNVARRQRLEGGMVMHEFAPDDSGAGGLRVNGSSALPFLLAARLATIDGAKRIFGDGIASSYQALLDTHRDDLGPDEPEGEAETAAAPPPSGGADWYLRMLRQAAESSGELGYRAHPKMLATVDLTMHLWRKGEKVLIFCHYRRTGRALRQYLSEAMLRNVEEVACEKLRVQAEALPAALQRITGRFDAGQAGARKTAEALIRQSIGEYPHLTAAGLEDQITEVVLRFVRTPTFLVRFGGLDNTDTDEGTWVQHLFAQVDGSGTCLHDLLRQFLDFLNRRSTDADRARYLDALDKIQTGAHAGPDVENSFADEEEDKVVRSKLAANVRWAYGETAREIRERIMLTFNTPFYPEILITSSVMSEGVDLHLNCRHVIHHDLDWNPSSLEQRTGRIDRIGSRAEQVGHSIKVYLPYVEGCQDEKLFRVVMDRERWFGVVMGAQQAMDRVLRANTWELEKLAEQPLVPEALASSLQLRLSVEQPENADCVRAQALGTGLERPSPSQVLGLG